MGSDAEGNRRLSLFLFLMAFFISHNVSTVYRTAHVSAQESK